MLIFLYNETRKFLIFDFCLLDCLFVFLAFLYFDMLLVVMIFCLFFFAFLYFDMLLVVLILFYFLFRIWTTFKKGFLCSLFGGCNKCFVPFFFLVFVCFFLIILKGASATASVILPLMQWYNAFFVFSLKFFDFARVKLPIDLKI